MNVYSADRREVLATLNSLTTKQAAAAAIGQPVKMAKVYGTWAWVAVEAPRADVWSTERQYSALCR